jgi:uncharacterized Zn-binding protein involved in type VI secretion
MKRALSSALLTLAIASPAAGQSAAARVGDPTSHGGAVTGPGVPSVLIAGQPAAVLGDQTSCPVVDGATQVPHQGGPIVTASATVIVGGRRAARVGDSNAENGSSATVVSGAGTVTIGP